jgi:hypothetical protein
MPTITKTALNDDIIAALDIAHLPEDKRQGVIEMATATIYAAVVSEAVEGLTDNQGEEFERLLDTEPDADKVLSFFSTAIPDFSALVAREVTAFIQGGRDVMDQIGK